MKLPFNLKLGKPKESKLFLALIPALKEKRTQQFSTIAFSIATISFFAIVAINPTLSTITDLQRQISDNSFVNDQMQKKISNITNLQTEYSNLQHQLDPVFAAVPTNPALDIFTGQLHTLATSKGVILNRVQTLPVDLSQVTLTTSKYLSYAFSVEIQGTLQNIYSFINALGNFNRLLTFDEVTINRTGIIDNTFRLSVRGNVFFKENLQ